MGEQLPSRAAASGQRQNHGEVRRFGAIVISSRASLQPHLATLSAFHSSECGPRGRLVSRPVSRVIRRGDMYSCVKHVFVCHGCLLPKSCLSWLRRCAHYASPGDPMLCLRRSKKLSDFVAPACIRNFSVLCQTSPPAPLAKSIAGSPFAVDPIRRP